MKDVKVSILILFLVLVLLFCFGCTNIHKEVFKDSNYSKDWILDNCDEDLVYNSSSEKHELSACANVSTDILESFILGYCKNRVRGWNNCQVEIVTPDNHAIWFEKINCLSLKEYCKKSEYCIMRHHSWSDGSTDIKLYSYKINETGNIPNYAKELLKITNDSDYKNYKNNREIYYSHIMNCYN